MNLAIRQDHSVTSLAHPNELDRKRIERAIEARKRYRYVSPHVVPMEGGYLIESPCCSRNVDPEGGMVDVARILCDGTRGPWRLFRKDHIRNEWEFYGTYLRLNALLDHLNADPERKFWQ